MKLNHLNLAVSEIVPTQRFLETYFGLETVYRNEKPPLVILTDEGGFILTLMQSPGEGSCPDTFHIGFIQGRDEKVNEVHRKLRDDGDDVKPSRHFHGSWTFYVRAPGGFLVEVQH